MSLDNIVENTVNEKPGLFRRSLNFVKDKALPVVLTISIGAGGLYGLVGCGGSKKPYIPTGPAVEFVEPDESRITQDPDNGIYLLKDQLLMGFNNGVSDAEKQEIIKNVNGNTIAIDKDLGIYQVNVSVTDLNDLYAKADILETDARVEFASPNYAIEQSKIPDTGKDPHMVGVGTWDEDNPAGTNWALEYIKAPSAWDYTTGSSNTNIAVVDFGFDKDHEDLKNNIVHTEPFWGLNPNNSHGTNVAGIIGAEGNNDYGITGMNWNTSLYLYKTPLKEETGFFDKIFDTSVLKYMKKIANNNIKIINFSGAVDWGLANYNPSDPNLPSDSNPEHIEWLEDRTQTYREMFNILKENGVLLIQSAGNDGIDAKWSGLITPTLATEFPDNYILVAANDNLGNIPGFSNYGNLITVSAPGASSGANEIITCSNNNSYEPFTGTSASAPFVTGLAGLLLSVNPNLTPAQIKKAIIDGAQAGGKFFTDPDSNDIYIINSLESILNVIDICIPINISNNTGNSYDPRIAVDSLDNLHVVWQDHTSPTVNGTIFYSKFDGGWSTPTNITDIEDITIRRETEIVIDSKDNLHVLWCGGAGAGDDCIYYTNYNGSNWSTAIKPFNNAKSPAIAVDSLDNLHVVYQDENDYVIHYSKYNEVSWSAPLNISNNPSTEDADDPSIAIDSLDNLHVAWEQRDKWTTLDSYIFYTKHDSSWSTPLNISPTTTNSGEPKIAIDSLDNLHVVWENYDSVLDSYDSFHSKFEGSWSTPTKISDGKDGWEPKMVIDSMNVPYVLFGSSSSGLFYSEYNGSSWLTPKKISDYGCHGVAIDSKDNLHIVVGMYVDSKYEIFYSFYKKK